MRNFTFRIWDKVEKEWLFGYETLGGFSLLGETVMMGELSSLPLLKLNDLVVMQSTGLCDKTGTPIFEGDIVTHKSREGNWNVVWNVRSAQYNVCKIGGEDNIKDIRGIKCFGRGMTVIGSIYTHPHLLTPLEV